VSAGKSSAEKTKYIYTTFNRCGVGNTLAIHILISKINNVLVYN